MECEEKKVLANALGGLTASLTILEIERYKNKVVTNAIKESMEIMDRLVFPSKYESIPEDLQEDDEFEEFPSLSEEPIDG